MATKITNKNHGCPIMRKLIIIIAASLSLAACGSGVNYSEGSRVGIVQKFSRKGLIFPTWEGELVMDGVKARATESGSSITNVWPFGAGTNDAIAAQIEAAMNDGYRVRLTYQQHLLTGPSWGNAYHVVKVERAP